MLAYRTPSGLLILIDSGAAPNPATGRMTMRRIVRLPCQRSRSTGWPAPAIHELCWPALNKLYGAREGSEPNVELAVTWSVSLGAGASRASSPSRARPGTAMALPLKRNMLREPIENTRAMGGYVAKSARLAGDGTCRWNENATSAASRPAGSWAGDRYLATVTPGIVMLLKPAPGPPGMPPRASSIVIRSVLLRPGTTRSDWGMPVRRTALVTVPAEVVTVSRSATGRTVPSASSLIPIEFGSASGRANVIWIHWPTGVFGLASAQYVLGSASNALTGSICGISASQDPDDEAVTLAAPEMIATV